MKNFVIVGGGSAGWLTALYLNKHYKDYNITIIDSSKIGILGAGESSTGNLPFFLRNLDIDENEFIERTKSTIKEAVEFITKVMSTPPDWCPDLPVACEAKYGESYGEC